MKKIFGILILLALVCLPARAQFKGTNNVAFGYASSLVPGDVLIIGRPGLTNYNLAGSNVFDFAQAAAGKYAVVSNQANLTLNDPFNLYSGGGSPVTWIFDILSGGGKSLSISQSGGGGVKISDTGGFSADDVIMAGGGFAGNGAGVSNAVNLIAGSGVTITTNADGKTFTLANSGGTVVGADLVSATNLIYQSGTNWAGPKIVSATNLIYTAATNFARDAAKLATGTIPTARLGTGTADATTYLRGDSSWATIPGSSQTPLGSQIDANNYGFDNVSGVGGRDDSNGSMLGLYSYDTDASILLYNYSTGFGIRYASTYGHRFTGAVTFWDEVIFSGGVSNALPWHIADAAISSATITNLTVYSSSFASASNTLALGNKPLTLIVGTDCAVTNLSGVTAGQENWASLQVSNSAASTISLYLTVGATVRAQGAASTNRLAIASGKIGYLTVQALGGSTNYWTTSQQ